MRTFFVVSLLVFLLGACSSSTASAPATTVDPRLVEGEPLADYGVTATEIKIGSSTFADEASETLSAKAGFKAYLDHINTQGGLAGKKYELVELDTTGDALTHIQNVRVLSVSEDAGVAMIALIEDDSLALVTQPELRKAQMLGLTLATEEQWNDPQSNIQNVTVSCEEETGFAEAFEKTALAEEDRPQFLQGWTQAKFVDAVILAAAKKGDITRPALAAMAAAFDQTTLC